MQELAVAAPDRDTSDAPQRPPLRVLAVASGKGGVGKTNVSANLAVAFALQGKQVWILDANLGLANVDVLFGLTPTRTILDVLRKERSLADVTVAAPGGVRIIPATRGDDGLAVLDAQDRLRLLAAIDALEPRPDVLLVDTATGISSNVLFFTAAATDALIVVTPEPTALTDAYALMKVLAARHRRREFLLVVNMAAGEADAEATFARLARVAEHFLDVHLEYVGYVAHDDAIPRAVRSRLPVMLAAPQSAASAAFRGLAERLGSRPAPMPTGGVQFFFRDLAEARS